MRGGQQRWQVCAVRPAGANTAQDTKCVRWLCSVLAVACADRGKTKAPWHSRWPECEAMQGGIGNTICRAAPCLITPPSPLHPHQPPTCRAPLPTMMPSQPVSCKRLRADDKQITSPLPTCTQEVVAAQSQPACTAYIPQHPEPPPVCLLLLVNRTTPCHIQTLKV